MSEGQVRKSEGDGPSPPRLPPTAKTRSDVPFRSVLFVSPGDGRDVDEQEPAFFGDLNLDQVLASMVAGREEYRLEPFFYTPLHDVDAVAYRHEVLRDLEAAPLREAVGAFAEAMRTMRDYRAHAKKLRYRYHVERWFLDAVATYCDAVESLLERLTSFELRSRGFLGVRDYLAGYVGSAAFRSLAAETRTAIDALGSVRYAVRIRGDRVTVTRYEGQADYSAEVEETFAKFKQWAAKDYRVGIGSILEMNHVEARILDLVARLHPDVFRTMDDHYARHQGFLDETIVAFDREVQFYLAYLKLMEPLEARGLGFCYPRVSGGTKEIAAIDAFDLALAEKLVGDEPGVVCNGLSLNDRERVLVVTGPNQGGKTTFARMFGQLHHLASLGLPVPGTEARLLLPDRIFTHFEREEDIRTLRGKLEDELARIHEILERATSDSLLIMNESFTSTTLGDALFLGKEIMGRIVELDLVCVYVTFVDELASLNEATVSMVAMVRPDNPALRTFEIVRRPADGLAYAAAIADKYGLTFESVKRRISA